MVAGGGMSILRANLRYTLFPLMRRQSRAQRIAAVDAAELVCKAEVVKRLNERTDEVGPALTRAQQAELRLGLAQRDLAYTRAELRGVETANGMLLDALKAAKTACPVMRVVRWFRELA